MWEKMLDNIRSGEAKIAVTDIGIPEIAVDASIYKLLQLLAAITAGYNRNAKRIEALRAIAKPMFKQEER